MMPQAPTGLMCRRCKSAILFREVFFLQGNKAYCHKTENCCSRYGDAIAKRYAEIVSRHFGQGWNWAARKGSEAYERAKQRWNSRQAWAASVCCNCKKITRAYFRGNMYCSKECQAEYRALAKVRLSLCKHTTLKPPQIPASLARAEKARLKLKRSTKQ